MSDTFARYEVFARHAGHWRAYRTLQLGREALPPSRVNEILDEERAGMRSYPKLCIMKTASRGQAMSAARVALRDGANDVSVIEYTWQVDIAGKKTKNEKRFIDYLEGAAA